MREEIDEPSHTIERRIWFVRFRGSFRNAEHNMKSGFRIGPLPRVGDIDDRPEIWHGGSAGISALAST